eukprot:scaffold2767_cov177-Amphora_coffeaeformis.AAC.24
MSFALPKIQGLSTDEEKNKVMTAEMAQLQKVSDDDGIDFSTKTAIWVAYEGLVESQCPNHRFDDVLAQHFLEPYEKRFSDCFFFGLGYAIFDPSLSGKQLDWATRVIYCIQQHKLT